MITGKKPRMITLCIAAALIVAALIWSVWLLNAGEHARLCSWINAHGYAVLPDDLYVAGAQQDATIQDLLPDVDMEQAVAASKQAGLPSDPQRRGDVALVLVALNEREVLTLFLVDDEVELGFVQAKNSTQVFPMGGQDAQDQTDSGI